MPQGSKGPLPGHTRVKKRMIPDFLLAVPMSFSRYEDDVLPEIVGIAILNDAFGYERGAELSLAIARELKSLGRLGSPFVSVFETLTDDEILSLQDGLNRAGALLDISKAFTPINRILAPTPLRFFEEHTSLSDDECLTHLSGCVSRHINRYSHPSTCTLATLYYTQTVLGRIHIAKGLHVPNLESIHTAPESEDGKRAAADVRIYSLMEIGMHMQNQPSDWPNVFWDRCRKSSKCEIWVPDEENYDEQDH